MRSGPRPILQPPLFGPETAWQLPSELPRIPAGEPISIDCETYDPGLNAGGAPASMNGGHIVGIAVGTADRQWYLPTEHAYGTNLNPDQVYAWARDLARSCVGRTVIGANLLYDLEFLAAEGIEFPAGTRFFDVQYAAALLDEQLPSYSLDAISRKWLGDGKVDVGLYEWIAAAHKVKPTRKACMPFLYTAPPEVVGPYAEADARLPFQLFDKMVPELRAARLTTVSRLEMRLIPTLLKMRRRGVRVDEERAHAAVDRLRAIQRAALDSIKAATGLAVDIWAESSLTALMTKAGVQMRYSATGQPSFRKDWLEGHPHPVVQAVQTARWADKLVSTFLLGGVLKQAINGRIHTQYHPLRSDEGGTVSGRFSSSDPNLQNLPARDPEAKAIVRSIFIPEPGEVWWKFDYSQIEYRLLAHEAVGRGSEAIRAAYREDPTTDYHEATQRLIEKATGLRLGRKQTKNINFGLAYGMMPRRLAESLGMELEDARPLFDQYHAALPFVQATFNKYSNEARLKGEVRTLTGRRRRFDKWVGRGTRGALPLSRDAAEAKWGRAIERAEVHKGLNQRLQGGAADIIKMAMLAMEERGVFDRVGVPLVTVHDEFGFSAPADCADMAEVRDAMEQCVKLEVPLLAEPETGATWGDCG